MTQNVSEFVVEHMEQKELFGIIGTNSFYGAISTAILIGAFFAFIRLLDIGLDSIAHTSVILGLFVLIYWYYFWRKSTLSTSLGTKYCTKDGKGWYEPIDKTWKDFFYTDKFGWGENFFALCGSLFGAAIAYFVILLFAALFTYLWSGAETPIGFAIVKMIVLGAGATAFYCYGNKNTFKLRTEYSDKFYLFLQCAAYGFTLSIASYTLGLIIGLSLIFLGIAVTLAIIILEFSFTGVYSYAALIEWSKFTHKQIVDEQKDAEKEAAKSASTSEQNPVTNS